MSRATAQCPTPSAPRPVHRTLPNAPAPMPRTPCRAPNSPRRMPRTQCPAVRTARPPAPNAPRPIPPMPCAPRPPPLGRYAAAELGCVGAARRRTGPFAPAALEAGALCDVAETFGWELDTRPKNRLPVELPPKLNLQPLELRLASLLPPLLLSGSATPAFSIARRSSSFQASERRPSSARAAFCAALTSWLRLGCVSFTCPAADGPAAAAAAPSASSCAGRSTASGVAITRTNLLARGCGAQPVTWGGATRLRYSLQALVRGRVERRQVLGVWDRARVP